MTGEEITRVMWEHRTAMLRLAYGMLRHAQNTEDAVSAAMLKAYQHADDLRDEGAAKAWLMRITANVCRDLLRRNRRVTLLPDAGSDVAVLFDFDGDAVYPQLMALPADTAQVLLLYYYEEMDTQQIAHILHIPAPTVRARLSRGRRMLRERLERSEKDEEL